MFQSSTPKKKANLKVRTTNKWKIYDVFYMLLLGQDTKKKRQVNETTSQIKLDTSNNKEYKVDRICSNKVYAEELDNGHL